MTMGGSNGRHGSWGQILWPRFQTRRKLFPLSDGTRERKIECSQATLGWRVLGGFFSKPPVSNGTPTFFQQAEIFCACATQLDAELLAADSIPLVGRLSKSRCRGAVVERNSVRKYYRQCHITFVQCR